MSGFDLPSFLRTIQEASALVVVLLSFNDRDSMKEFLKQNSRSRLLPSITYRLAYRRHRDLTLQVTEDGALDVNALHGDHIGFAKSEFSFDSHWYVKTLLKESRRRGSEYGEYIWDLIDPETLRLTGTSTNCLDEVLR